MIIRSTTKECNLIILDLIQMLGIFDSGDNFPFKDLTGEEVEEFLCHEQSG